MVVFVWTFTHSFLYVSAEPEAAIFEPVKTLELVKPSKLAIPSLNILADVQHVGLTAKGNMATPSNFTDVAWYKYGPAPGASGSAVIAGHLDSGLGFPGVFKNLIKISKGSEILVTDSEGVTLRFVVTEVNSYPYASVPTESVFSITGEPRLALITCGGRWVPGEKTYDRRLVVYADIVT